MRPILLTWLLGWSVTALLVREAAPDAWALPFVAHVVALVVAAAAIVAIERARRRGGASRAARGAQVFLLVLGIAAGLRLFPVRIDPEGWRAGEEARLRGGYARTNAALRDAATRARQLGDAALALLGDSTAAATAPARAEDHARLFTALAALVRNDARATDLAEAGGAGIQLFDAHGRLVAWAGSPHSEETSTRLTRFAQGARQTYFRRSGVYTLLTYDRRDPRLVIPADTTGIAPLPESPRVLVDVPVEVHYQLSNRFLQSGSLSSALSGHGLEVGIIYDADEIPPYLTRADLEILGDEHSGIQGEGVLRDSEGVILGLCHLTGLPYADRIERVERGVDLVVGWLLAVAVGAGLLATGAALRGAGSRHWRLLGSWPVVGIGLVWGLRLLLAALDLPTRTWSASVLNPAFFAMVGFGRMLRSPLDLLLTSLALVATSGLLFLRATRSRARDVRGLGGGSWVHDTLTALAAATVVGLAVWFGLHFVGRVAADSNPRLAGTQLDWLSPPVLCIHLALLVGVAALLCLALLVGSALLGRRSRRTVWLVAVAAGMAGVLWFVTTPIVALVGIAVFASAARLHALLDDDRFTSFALASFALVALTATLVSEAVQREYFQGYEAQVRQRAGEILSPNDELRRYVLDEVLAGIDADPSVALALSSASAAPGELASTREAERSALAFEIWARSLLSHLGYSCQVRVYDSTGLLVSEFAVDMPVGADTAPRDLLERVRADGRRITQSEVAPSPSGSVRLYGGAAPVPAGARGPSYLGAVVIELPFAHESLELAANPHLRTPELLRNAPGEGVAPRVEEPDRMLLAWLDKPGNPGAVAPGGFVLESSTPYLEVGQPLREVRATKDGWERLRLVDGDYLATRTDAASRVLLAGFRLETPLEHLLEWAQIGSFEFGVTLVVLLGFLGLVRWQGGARFLPPLLLPKRLGFQQKLMGAFLVMSLLPSVVLSVATRNIMSDRSVRRNRDAALEKARSAEAALTDLVRRDLDAVRESDYLHEILKSPEQPAARDIGQLEYSQIMVFRGDGAIVLDETLSNLSDAEARAFVQNAPRTVFASRDPEGKYLYLGSLVQIWYSPREDRLSESAPDARPYYLFYRRRLTDKLLGTLAPILNTELSGFLGPGLVVSSQKSLATAGLLPALVPPDAYTHLILRRNRYAVAEEHTGRQRYFAGYLPLEDRFGERVGALSVSQLLEPDEFSVEVERTRALVVGLSTLMFVLTLVLGVAFASRIFDPVRRLIEGTRRIAGGDLAFRLRARSGDEIGELERSFNDMAVRLQSARWALEERRRHLETVLGNIASGVVATDEHGRIVAANPATYRILDLPAGSLEGRTWTELAAAEAAADEASFWTRLGEAPDGEVVEITRTRGEERLTLRVIVTDLRPAGGEGEEHLGRVAIFEDVTELIRSKKLAAWAEMARQVAHEIKNPLTPLKLSAQFMERAYRDRSDKFPQIFSEGMATIVEQVEALRRIATEFSTFGRVQKLEPRGLDLGQLLRRVTSPYRKIEGLELEILDGANGAAPPGHMPGEGVMVLGDEDGLRKVFTNLLENAREAMGGRGRITLCVQSPDRGHVDIHVADHGAGLSPEATSRLFEPYFSTKSTGTGLGLAITKGILEELGGSIALVNRPEGGAEARVTLALY